MSLLIRVFILFGLYLFFNSNLYCRKWTFIYHSKPYTQYGCTLDFPLTFKSEIK